MDNHIKKFPANQPENYGYVSESESMGMYVENYSKEMELRSQSIEVQKQEAEYSSQFSKMALEMKMEGRKAQWSHFAGGLGGYGISKGKKQEISEKEGE